MKKTLLSIMGVAVSVFAFGQAPQNVQSLQNVMPQNGPQALSMPSAPATSINRAAGSGNGTQALGATLFSETFGAGLAGDGTNGAWTTNGNANSAPSAAAVWEYRGPNTTPDITSGSRGAWAGPAGSDGDPVNSPTTANGFFIFDSDYLDNGGSETGAGLGSAPAPHESWLISPVFSTVGSSDIVIDFTTYFRRFAGNAYVLLSNDGGATWPDSLTIFDTQYGVNNASDDDLVINGRVNTLANSATARIAFFFDGVTPDASANGLGYYFAMVDDVTIGEAPDNNLSYEGSFYETTFDAPLANYYSMVPSSLADMDTIMFSANISNVGSVDQPNTKITNNIVTPTGTMALSSTPVSVAAGADDSLVISTPFVLDQGVGMYSWVFDVSSDSVDDVPSNNFSDTAFIEVTDTTYARDYRATGTFTYTSGSPYEMGNKFEIAETVKATSISVIVGTGSTAGEPISVYLYSYVETPTDIITTLISSSEFHVLDAANITAGAAVAYDIPEVLLTPGRYLATYKTYSTSVGFGQSDFVSDPLTSFVDVGGTGSFSWADYTTPVRLNVSTDLWVCDLSVTAFQTGNNAATATASNGTAPYVYLWSDGSGNAAATSLQSGPAPGGYTHFVTVTDDSACVASASVNIITGIIEAGIEGSVDMYPNPNNGSFTLNLEGVTAGEYTVSVKNIIGQSVYQNVITVNGNYNGNIQLNSITNGIYFMEILNSNNEKSVVKFIVK